MARQQPPWGSDMRRQTPGRFRGRLTKGVYKERPSVQGASGVGAQPPAVGRRAPLPAGGSEGWPGIKAEGLSLLLTPPSSLGCQGPCLPCKMERDTVLPAQPP